VNIQIKDITVTRKSIVVSLEAKEVDVIYQGTVAQVSRQAQLPGFRPGKAPAAVIAKRFAKPIAEEFRQNVMNQAYRAATESKDVTIAAVANFEPGEIEQGKDAVLTVTVDVMPDFQVPEYLGLPTEIQTVEVTDQDIDGVIEGLRAERAEFKSADRPAQKGDYVKLGYEGKVDGQAIAEIAPDRQVYGKVPQTWEEVEGQNEGVIPGLGAQLKGLKAGDKQDVNIQFPAEFPAVPALAGKSAVYSIEVQEIRERILPEINEEFLKANKFESLDALKTQVRERLKGQKEMQNIGLQRRQVLDALSAKVDFPLPEAIVENEAQVVMRQFVNENLRRGVPQEQLQKDQVEIFENAKKMAAARVKSQFIIAKIAGEQKINIEERDLDTFLYREAMRTGANPDKILKDLSKNRDTLREVQRSIIFDKAVDFLVSKATVSTVPAKA
jgi:trigger factor